MKFGVHIGHMGGALAEMRRLWKFAEASGFDWLSVSDHFQESPPRDGDMDCYEAIATLSAAAMDTTRVRLGSGVYCVAYRNPGLLAKSLTTIDHLSNGRVECGLGAGWHDVEAKAFGIAFPSIGPREDMLEEYAQIMRLLFDPEQPRVNSRASTSRSPAPPTIPSRCSRAFPSGSAGAVRSARSAPLRNTPTGGTARTSGPPTGSARATCSTAGARRKDAIRRRSCAPSISASTSESTRGAPRAQTRCSAATSAPATAPTARAISGGP
jgi:alkanesulfonate monooxygenase SsuD/methylene tetrahydromethanopterin reductase-like flavin-dependent oxidoreductase (luciferase family)